MSKSIGRICFDNRLIGKHVISCYVYKDRNLKQYIRVDLCRLFKFPVVFLSLFMRTPGWYLKLHQDRFLPSSLQFIISE